MKPKLRCLLGIVIAAVCTLAAVRLFDWDSVGASLHSVKFALLLGSGMSVLAAIFLLRGIRWLVVLELPMTAANIASSSLANGAASGLAVLTPFQLGELLKIRLLTGKQEDRWRFAVSGFLVERVMDFGALVGMSGFGLALHLGHEWLAVLGVLAPLASALLLTWASAYVHLLPRRMHPYLEAFRHPKLVLLSIALLTVPLWVLNGILWWCAVVAMGVPLEFGQACTLMGGVMLVIMASLAPAGLGVSELGSRGIMLWFGYSVAEAEASAIGLRLLTPLVVLAGVACLALHWAVRRTQLKS